MHRKINNNNSTIMSESFSFDKRTERLRGAEYDLVSPRTFNLVMILTILYGLVLNVAIVHFGAAPLLQYLSAAPNPKLAMIVLFVGYFVCSIAGVLISAKSAKPMVSFIGFNLVAIPFGVLLCLIIPFFDGQIVLRAIGLTACVTAIIAALALTNPNLFLKLGWALFITLLVGLIAEVIATFAFHYQGTAFDWIFVIVFSGYIGFDVSRSQQYAKTVDNAVDCAVDLYMDIINLFVRLLSILGKRK